MKLRLLLAATLLPFLPFAQLSLPSGSLGEVVLIDFDNTVSGVNNGHFEGSGFTTSPATGQLNSNAWRYTSAGMSPTGSTFGGTANTGDAARGIYDGITGGAAGSSPSYGIYSYKTNNIGTAADYCIGTFIPGPTTITLRVQNNTGSTINVARLGFDAKYFNNRNDGTRTKFGYSSDDITYTDVSTMESFSATTPSGSTWKTESRSATLSNLSWANGAYMYFQWTITKINATGYSDPVGIDNITIQGFDAKYLFDGSQWVAPNNEPSGADPGAVAFVLYGSSIASISTSTSLSTIFVEPQARLDVQADLTVSDSAVIAANSNGYGQVIGEIVGTTRWQSYRTTTAGRWFNMAFPISSTWDQVSGIPIQTVANANQTNLWYYDAADTSGTLSDGTFKHITDQTTAPTDSFGYQLYAGDGTYFGSGPFTVELTGALLDDTVYIDVEGHSSGRFNLIPNPYPSALNWEDVEFLNTELGATYYIQDGEPDVGPGSVLYREYTATSGSDQNGSGTNGATKLLPPGQAFFVTVDATTDGTLLLRNGFREMTGAPSLFKTTAVPGSIKLRSEETSTGRGDETAIRFDGLYSDNYGFREDGVNMMNTGFPNIYTHADGKDLVFNGLDNSFSNTKDVDLYFQGDNAGNYEISIAEDGLPAEWTVVLEDKMTATFTDLRKSNYTYSHATGANADRFILHFNKTGAIGLEEFEEAEVYSFVTGDVLTVSLDEIKNADITIYDVSGREMARFANQAGQTNIDMSEWSSGVYVVSVSANGKLVYQDKIVH